MSCDIMRMQMRIDVSHRKQSAEEIAVWERWTQFTDQLMVAPDTPRDAEWMARRFLEAQGKTITADEVRAMMPENHPNYHKWRA